MATFTEKFKEIANAIRDVEGRTATNTIAAKDFAAEIRKLDPVLKAHAGDFENGYYGIRAVQCAATYLLARVMGTDTFAYHTNNIFSQVAGRKPPVRYKGYAQIDCSAFVGLCLRGIPYEKSPYAAHKGANDTWAPSSELQYLYGTMGWEFKELDAQQAGVFNDLGIAGCSTVRYAADLGRYFYKYGRVLYDKAVDGEITDHSSIGLQPGDLVFWDTSDKADVDARFKSISHVAIVAENTGFYYQVTGTQVDKNAGENPLNESVVLYTQFANSGGHPTSKMVLAVRPDYRPRVPKEETPIGVNLLGYPWTYSRNLNSTAYGLTRTVMNEHTILINGTPVPDGNDSGVTIALKGTKNTEDHITLSPGTYRLTGIEGFTGTSFALQIRNAAGYDFAPQIRYPTGTQGAVNEFTLDAETDVIVRLYVSPSVGELSNVKVTPTLIRIA